MRDTCAVETQTPRIHERGVELLNAAAADKSHVHLHLVFEELHGAVDAGQTVGGHGVEEWTADANALGAEAEGLDDVGGTTHAAVDVDFDSVFPAAFAENGHHFGEDFDAGPCEVELAAAVVGEDDAVDAAFDGADHIFHALDTLEDDGHFGDGEEPGNVFPGKGGVDEGGDGTGGALGAVDVVTGGRLDVGA